MSDITIEDNFNVQDLINVANVIDIATRRGAFQASETSNIGAVYDRLIHFIKLAQEANKPLEEIEEEYVVNSATSK